MRVIDAIEGSGTGPLLILIGGLHGNEKEGILAIKRVFAVLRENNCAVNGKIIGLRGNLKALQVNQRFISYDLNRCWTKKHANYLRQSKHNWALPEDEEARALLDIIDEYAGNDQYSEKILADLHTTSSDSGAFLIIPEYFARSGVVKALNVPVITNAEHYLKGTLMVHACDQDFISFSFEGGQMYTHSAVEVHETGIWTMMKALNMMDDFPGYAEDLLNFRHYQSSPAPEYFKMIHLHRVHQNDNFRMNPGYRNLSVVKRGEEIAYDYRGAIRSPEEGYIFMPLYQDTGEDGFFLVVKESG